MEISQKDYVEQLYKSEIQSIISALMSIERRLTQLKLDKFASSVKAIVVMLNVEEIGIKEEKV